MPRRALPLSVCSSSPSRLSCLAVLTAAWGSHSFRPPLLTHRDLGTAGASSRDSRITTAAAVRVARAVVHGKGTTQIGVEAICNQRRRPPCGGFVARSSSSDATASVEDAGGDVSLAVASLGVEERPWLGNGPDPMTKTDKVRPGTSASLGAGQTAVGGGRGGEGGGGGATAEDRVWLGNGPDPLASMEAAAAAAVVTEGGGKGKGVPAEEMWLNGPFKAPLPPGPLVSKGRDWGQDSSQRYAGETTFSGSHVV